MILNIYNNNSKHNREVEEREKKGIAGRGGEKRNCLKRREAKGREGKKGK